MPLTKHLIVYIVGLTWGGYLGHRILNWDTVHLTKMTGLFSKLRRCFHEMKDSSNPFSLPTVTNSAFNIWNFQVSFRGGNCWGLEWASQKCASRRCVNYFELKLLKKQSMWEEHADLPFCFPENRKWISLAKRTFPAFWGRRTPSLPMVEIWAKKPV